MTRPRLGITSISCPPYPQARYAGSSPTVFAWSPAAATFVAVAIGGPALQFQGTQLIRGCFPYPRCRNDLPALPAPLVPVQLPQLRQVARLELHQARSEVPSLRIDRPGEPGTVVPITVTADRNHLNGRTRLDPQRIEQLRLRILQDRLAGRLHQDGRQ